MAAFLVAPFAKISGIPNRPVFSRERIAADWPAGNSVASSPIA
jgi:hypothetical protein